MHHTEVDTRGTEAAWAGSEAAPGGTEDLGADYSTSAAEVAGTGRPHRRGRGWAAGCGRTWRPRRISSLGRKLGIVTTSGTSRRWSSPLSHTRGCRARRASSRRA